MRHRARLLLISSFLSLFFFIKNIEAKSGCCSSHGGVNCSAGSQSNGHVICNDGWTGSSCLYSEMVMCGGSSTGSSTTLATATPKPTSTPVPTKVPTSTPTLTPTPTLVLTPTLTSAPTSTPVPTEIEEASPTPDSQAQVLGETTAQETKALTISDYLISFSALGSIGFGIYKLFIKIKNKF